MLDGDRCVTVDPFPAVAGLVAAIASIAMLGVAIGTIVRHRAGTVAAVIGVEPVGRLRNGEREPRGVLRR